MIFVSFWKVYSECMCIFGLNIHNWCRYASCQHTERMMGASSPYSWHAFENRFLTAIGKCITSVFVCFNLPVKYQLDERFISSFKKDSSWNLNCFSQEVSVVVILISQEVQQVQTTFQSSLRCPSFFSSSCSCPTRTVNPSENPMLLEMTKRRQ